VNDQSQTTVPPRLALLNLINAYRLSQLIYVAAELNVADLLKDGPKHYQQLAEASGVDPDALYRCLRALASAGVFMRMEGDRFGLNALADNLRRDVPGSLHAWAILQGQQVYPTWGNLLLSVKTGQVAFEQLHGMSLWEYLEKQPASGQVFDQALGAVKFHTAAALVKAYDFSRFRHVVDVGGGQGVLLAAILKAHPAVRGVLFDLEKVVASSKEWLKQEGLLERCEVHGGSFFDGVPSGGDAYILSHVIQDWDNGKSVQILKNCRRAMSAHQTLLIIERGIASDGPTVEAVLSDINMLVMVGGRERTREEYESLLSTVGFELTSVIPTQSPDRIFEAIAA
jgi:hypothetical protein